MIVPEQFPPELLDRMELLRLEMGSRRAIEATALTKRGAVAGFSPHALDLDHR
jgi:hypothetical protein